MGMASVRQIIVRNRPATDSGTARAMEVDVRPTEGDHLQGAAEHDALLQVAGHETDERAGHERLVELELVQNTLHTGQ